MYNTMQYSNENTTYYLVKSHNAQEVNKACNISLITKGIQENGMKIIFPWYNTGFYSLQEDDKKEAEKSVE